VTVQIHTVEHTYGSVIRSEHKRAVNTLGLASLGFVPKQFESRAQNVCFSVLPNEDLANVLLYWRGGIHIYVM
jgi:hypothetical protein